MPDTPAMIRGLRTVIYGVPDLPRARDWYARAFGTREQDREITDVFAAIAIALLLIAATTSVFLFRRVP